MKLSNRSQSGLQFLLQLGLLLALCLVVTWAVPSNLTRLDATAAATQQAGEIRLG